MTDDLTFRGANILPGKNLCVSALLCTHVCHSVGRLVLFVCSRLMEEFMNLEDITFLGGGKLRQLGLDLIQFTSTV